jgi:cytochrome c556
MASAMTRAITAVLAAAGALTVAAAGALATAAGPTPQTGSLSPEQVIAARQASFDMSVMTMSEMKIAVRDSTDVTKQFYPATTLARWAKVLPTLFPAGTGSGATALDTHARPEIWTDRAGFEKAAADYAAAADTLATLAQGGDAAGFKAQLDRVTKSCDACHANYKAK